MFKDFKFPQNFPKKTAIKVFGANYRKINSCLVACWKCACSIAISCAKHSRAVSLLLLLLLFFCHYHAKYKNYHSNFHEAKSTKAKARQRKCIQSESVGYKNVLPPSLPRSLPLTIERLIHKRKLLLYLSLPPVSRLSCKPAIRLMKKEGTECSIYWFIDFLTCSSKLFGK